MTLNVVKKNECDIGELIDSVINSTNQEWDIVEAAFFDLSIYPEDRHGCHLSFCDKTNSVIPVAVMNKKPLLKWVDESLVSIFKESNIKSLHVVID